MEIKYAILLGILITLSFLWIMASVIAHNLYWERIHQNPTGKLNSTPRYWAFFKSGPLIIWKLIKNPTLPEIN
jgi:hypothetical protein